MGELSLFLPTSLIFRCQGSGFRTFHEGCISSELVWPASLFHLFVDQSHTQRSCKQCPRHCSPSLIESSFSTGESPAPHHISRLPLFLPGVEALLWIGPTRSRPLHSSGPTTCSSSRARSPRTRRTSMASQWCTARRATGRRCLQSPGRARRQRTPTTLQPLPTHGQTNRISE